MNDERRPLDSGGLVAGILLIAVGTMFLLDRIGYIDFHMTLTDYWPMALVLFGASRFLNGPRRRMSGVWMIIIGLWLQAINLHWWDMTFASSWPLLVIAIGAMMVVRAVLNAMEVRHDH
jgi:hypothetical protein